MRIFSRVEMKRGRTVHESDLSGSVMVKWSWSVSGELLFLLLELSDQIVRSADTILNVVQLALSVINTLGLSAHVCGAERVDVVVIVSLDQRFEILVIESFAVAGDGAGHFVVVQIDVHLAAVPVEE